MDMATVEREVLLLQHEIAKFNERDAQGRFQVTFGKLYDATEQIFEALAGTLKAAKKRGIIDYASPLLLKGTHDKIIITLLKEATEPAPSH